MFVVQREMRDEEHLVCVAHSQLSLCLIKHNAMKKYGKWRYS
jgi:hypothetical protein